LASPSGLSIDEKALGVGVAAVALALRAPVLLAALVTALARLFLQRIAVTLASCLALLTYHLIVGTIPLFFSIRVRLLMHPSPHPFNINATRCQNAVEAKFTMA
jgi:hypothetical protein